MIYGAQNELVFGANELKTNHKKTPKTRLLRTIGVKSAGWKAPARRPVEGGYMSKEFDVAGIRNPPGAEPGSGGMRPGRQM
jgi:hypothetical protein